MNTNENQQSKALILCDSNIEDIFLYSIETTFNFEVSISNNWTQMIQFFTKDQYSLLIIAMINDKEIYQKISQLFISLKNDGKSFNMALILIGEYNNDNEDIKKIIEINKITLLQQKINVLEISTFITNNFIRDESCPKDEFSPISLKTLMRFKCLSFPVYIKLKTRYLMVLSVGDAFYSDDLSKYHNKGITHLFLKKKAARWILDQIDNQMDFIIENKLGSLDLPTPSSEINDTSNESKIVDNKTNGVISKDQFIDKQSESSSTNEEDLLVADEFRITNNADAIISSIGKPFKLQEDQIAEIKNSLDAVVKVVMKNPDLCKLLKQFKINRNKSDYYISHIGSLINVCTAVATTMDWKTERTIEKLVYASYFHDIGLSEKPELAIIKNENEAKEKSLSANDLKLYLNHPTKMATLLKEIKSFPEDVHSIVEQHHELPGGGGFPKGISSTRIIPLAAVFIISHSFVDYIIENKNWNLSEYIIGAKKEFLGNAFRKIIQSLEKIKD